MLANQDHMKAWTAIILLGVGIILSTTSEGSLAVLGVLFLCMGFIMMILSNYGGDRHHLKPH